MEKIKLGDLLIEQKIIQQDDLESALSNQEDTGQKLGDILIEMGLLTEDDLLSLLANQLNYPFVDLKYYNVKSEVVKKIPEVLARRFKMIPIDIVQKRYLVATSDPTDIQAYDHVVAKLDLPARFVVAKAEDIINILNRTYRTQDDIRSVAGELASDFSQVNQLFSAPHHHQETPIAKLLYSIIKQAYLHRASDIHLEPGDNGFSIRYRIDGLLQENEMAEPTIYDALVLRIKLISSLDISEHRLPQDGRFSVTIEDREIDVRVSTLPVAGKETLVLRLLDKQVGIKPLDNLGLTLAQLSRFNKHIHYPHGMILVCGPTGCGKTTTLYSALACINTPQKKILTVEDPVEYRISRVNQIQIQPKIGLDFATVLRAALRHDPDILMVGEIRDYETADIALKAAMTGHLVFSTLHTYDAMNAPIRLMDMGVAPYIIASSLRLIISQRLLRQLCDECKEPMTPSEEESAWLSDYVKEPLENTFYREVGCTQCGGTGFKGRIGVYELLEINQDIAFALRQHDLNRYIELLQASTTFHTLLAQAIYYAQLGTTSLAEAMTIGYEIETDRCLGYENLPLHRHQSSQ